MIMVTNSAFKMIFAKPILNITILQITICYSIVITKYDYFIVIMFYHYLYQTMEKINYRKPAI